LPRIDACALRGFMWGLLGVFRYFTHSGFPFLLEFLPVPNLRAAVNVSSNAKLRRTNHLLPGCYG
jgi:hypothetical protein